MLGKALTAAHRVALSMTSASAEVEHGVSANLCEAIHGLVQASMARQMDVSIAAAPARPTFATHRVTFSAEGAAALGEVARSFRATSPREDFVLEGAVVKLENPSVSVGAPGEAVLAALVDGAMKRVTVELEASDYALVVDAHRQGRIVSMHGELAKVKRSWMLKNPRALRVRHQEPDELD
ncbi:MAG TPA: hypothetical protein VK550_28275 [Polyangiaceae bacterium]|nr:hypothetical protein [Polyangiaceae bacterium]